MTETNSFTRQPTKIDYASPTQFKFGIIKLPKVEFFVTSVNLPGISMDAINQSTPLRDIPKPGTKLNYEDLTMTFIVDEDLANYQEIHGWLVGLGFPKDHSQFKNLMDASADRFPTSSGAVSNEIGKVKYGAQGDGGSYSDATLTILTNKNNAVTEVRFSDVFPVSLSGLVYDQQATDVNYLTAQVSFKYSLYEFAAKGATTTSVVTT